MKYKLRIYKTKGSDKGNLHHEEFFNTFEDMKVRYKELYRRELKTYNATAWEYKEHYYEFGFDFGANWYRISDALMQT